MLAVTQCRRYRLYRHPRGATTPSRDRSIDDPSEGRTGREGTGRPDPCSAAVSTSSSRTNTFDTNAEEWFWVTAMFEQALWAVWRHNRPSLLLNPH